MTKILVSGSRDWQWEHVKIIHAALDICEKVYAEYHLIHGGCQGVDAFAGAYAFTRGMITTSVPAKWDKYGNRAGPIRNAYMLKHGKPDVLIAFHEDISRSRGTGHMVKIARQAKLPTIVIASLDDAMSIKDNLPCQ